MKKNFLISLLAIVSVVLTGCEETKNLKTSINYLGKHISVFCDKETNIEYLIFDGYEAGGLSVRYDTDGHIKTCKGI